MKAIQPVSLWINGTIQQANVFSLISYDDNLTSRASLNYNLGQQSQTADGPKIVFLQEGTLTIEGEDYESWSNQPDVNTWVYQWAAEKLNLVIL